MRIYVLMAFFCILVDFHCSDHSARLSEVEHNPKMSIWFFDDLGGLFMHFGQLSLLRLLGQSSEVEHNPKMSISFFDDLGGLSLHFGWLLLLRSLSQSSEVESNPKMSISFLMT